jgi:hypothetical protein
MGVLTILFNLGGGGIEGAILIDLSSNLLDHCAFPNRSTSLDPNSKVETNALPYKQAHLFSLYTMKVELWANHMG